MSLLRLLTAGKSLIGLKESQGRYAVKQHGMLPRFGAKDSDSPKPNKAGDPTAADTWAASPAKATSAAAAVPPGACQPAAPSRESKGLLLLGWWKPKLKGPAIPRFHRPMVQGELSLDSVKVVRNDLRDSDLEVTTRVTKSVGPERARPAQEVPETETSVPALPGSGSGAPAAAGSWVRMTERLFGAGK